MANDSLPTSDNFRKLPVWARVAFAIRCARRVQPMFSLSWPGAPAAHVQAIESAITHAQSVAARPYTARAAAITSYAEYAIGVANASANINIANDAQATFRINEHAKAAALVAASAAASAYNPSDPEFASATYSYVHHRGISPGYNTDAGYDFNLTQANIALQAAIDSLYAIPDEYDGATTDWKLAVSDAIRLDFEMLIVLAARHEWTDDSSVDITLLGPLWHDGAPPGWPEHEVPPPAFTLAIDPGDADMETIREVMTALSDLHEAHTGYALNYRVEGALIHAHSEVCA